MARSATPAAWYRDPADARVERWWDGTDWTGATRPVGATDFLWGGPAAAPPPPVEPWSAGHRRPLVAGLVAGAVVVAAAVTAGAVLSSAAPGREARTASSPLAASPAAASAAAASPAASTSASTSAALPVGGSAVAVLASLPVKGPAPMTGYAREEFGQQWLDADRNGCDTRNDVLRRDLTATTGAGCRVLSGVLADPYTGRTIEFRRGAATSTAVQIDHVVALADAWRTGAQRLTAIERAALANDPVGLLAVDGPTNERKRDGDAATWLPPDRSFRCAYVARQIAVKRTYGLWVVPAERDAMARVLAACPPTAVPVSTLDVDAVPAGSSIASVPPSAGSAPTTAAADPRYRTCADAKRAGAETPYRSGVDPEYAWYQDRDGDGVVCE